MKRIFFNFDKAAARLRKRNTYILGLGISSISCLGLIFLLNSSIKVDSRNLPAIGSFFSPFTGFWANAENHHKSPDLITSIPGITENVEIEFDERMVPHIFANNTQDAYAAMGFLHAKYRLFQMDLVSRSASGRLAEILGPKLISRDRSQRRMGLAWGAEKAVSAWKQSSDFQLIEAFTNGYNTFLDQLKPQDYPIEFKLLGFEPEPWSPYRSALLMKSMAQSLCSRNDDIKASNTKKWLGESQYAELFPEIMIGEDPVIPKSFEFPFNPKLPEPASRTEIDELIGHQSFENPPEGIGSNNWAVAGTKTKSGSPILANDPHLNLTLPSVWYEAHMITPETNVYGVTLAGWPGVILGFNEDIAWGFTNVGHDMIDWYKIDWVDDKKNEYYLNGDKVKSTIRLEEIKVKGEKTFVDSVFYTHWGPVFHDGLNDEDRYPSMAMKWIAHETPRPEEVSSVKLLNQAKNFDDYTMAAQGYQSPAQNVAFISNSGDIALRVQGRFPVKSKGQGLFVLDGNKSENDWKGWVPKDQTPAILNPERGFISSANQRSTGKNYSYYYNGHFEQYRGRILNRELAKINDIRIEDMMALQQSSYSLKAEEFLPLLLPSVEQSNFSTVEKDIYTALSNWDFRYLKDSRAPALFDIWYKLLEQETWDEFRLQNEKSRVIFPRSWKLKELLSKKPDHIFFDLKNTPEKENAANIISQTFKLMCTHVSDMEKDTPITLRSFHPVSIPHLSRIPAFGKNNISIDGCPDALNAVRNGNGPSWRMLVEHGNPIKAYGVYPGGQSGNPGSHFYQTGIDNWAKGEYFHLEFVNEKGKLRNKLFQLNIN